MSPPIPSDNHAPAADGGWGWFIVLSSFLLQALTIGITYTFGVVFVKFMEVFGSDEGTTSWIGSIQPCLLYFTGIIAGPLIKRFGWRIVTICGSVLSALGFFVSSFAPNVYMLYFTYGALTGIGNGLMYVTSMVAVQHWFDRKRAMATGLAVSGSGVGTLVFGFLTQYLIDTVDWQWTLRVEALIMLLGVICGILFRPLPDVEDMEDSIRLTDSQKQEREIQNGPRWAQEEEEEENPGFCGDCGGILKEMFDFSLFLNPVFAMYCFVIVMFCFGYHVPYTYTPERAQGLGVSPQPAAFLVSIMGISNVCARLIFGWLGDKSPNIRFYLAGLVLTCGGIVSILVFLFNTYATLVVYSVLFGGFTGCWASLFPVILVDLLGIEVIEKSLGQCLAAGSIAFLLASPMSGLIIQKTGDIRVPYYVVGAAETFGGLVYFFIPCMRRRPDYEAIPEGEPIKRRRYVSESFS